MPPGEFLKERGYPLEGGEAPPGSEDTVYLRSCWEWAKRTGEGEAPQGATLHG